MPSIRYVLGMLVGAWLVGACGDDDSDKGSDGATISCDIEAPSSGLHQCVAYSVPTNAADAIREGCTSGGGTLVASCPTADRLGSCTLDAAGGISITNHYYADGTTTAEATEQLCSSAGGSWDPG